MENVLGQADAVGRGGRVRGLGQDGLIAPRACVCCGATASGSAAVARADGVEVIVNVCDACQAHAGSFGTARLSAVIASFVLGSALAAALPVLWPWLPLPAYAASVLMASVLPMIVGYVLRKRPSVPHAASGRGAWWSERDLCAANGPWALEFAELNGAKAELCKLKEPWFSAWMLAGSIFAAGGVGLFYWLHHPLLRIINVTDGRVHVIIDGRLLASVEPTSVESPAAGVELRVPSGARELVVRSAADGRLVTRQSEQLDGGRLHLFAPGSDGYCFWLESTGYGRAGRSSAYYEPLPTDRGFWTLPRDVDTWFAPNPPPGEGEARASGGILTALRQAPCGEAPRQPRSPDEFATE